MSLSEDTIPFPRRVGPFVILMTKRGGMRIRVDSITSFNEAPADRTRPTSRLGTMIRYTGGVEFWSVHSLSQMDEVMHDYYQTPAEDSELAELPY